MSAATLPSDGPPPGVSDALTSYLRQRGFTGALEQTASGGPPRDLEIKEFLNRSTVPVHYGLHVPPQSVAGPGARGYEECYARLCAWIRLRPADEQRELSQLRFPMFIHCFLALMSTRRAADDANAPAHFLEAHSADHTAAGASAEKKKQVEQFMTIVRARPPTTPRPTTTALPTALTLSPPPPRAGDDEGGAE